VLTMRLRPLLMSRVGPYASVMRVVESVFQRAPDIVQEFRDAIEQEGPMTLQVKKSTLIDVVCEKIEWLCSDLDNSQTHGLPSKVSSYVEFVELISTRLKESSSGASKEWSVFHLDGYPSRSKEPEPIDEEGYVLRTKLKKEIKSMGFAASVQTEVDNNRIWFRIAFVKKLKDRIKTSQKLEKSPGKFVVYYPGEPYFYATKSIHDVVRTALSSCLGCERVRPIQLHGKEIASLRRLRLGRDARARDTSSAKTEDHRFTVFDQTSRINKDMEETSHPILDKMTLHISKQLEDVGIKLDCRVDIAGSDLIGGLHDLMDEGIIDSEPAPAWITNLDTAGRSTFRLQGPGPGPGSVLGAGGAERAWDQESLLSRAAWL